MIPFTIAIALFVHSAIAVFSAGALWGFWQGEFKKMKPRERRNDLAMCWSFAVIPIVGPFVGIFGTGFLSHGWRNPFKAQQ